MTSYFKKLRKTLTKIRWTWSTLTSHPLSANHKLATLRRYLLFHLSRRVFRKPSVYPYVNDLRLVGRFGGGVTGNIYFGLHDFEDMSFVLHFLRGEDLFVDVGANCGSYTLLAAGACGCKTIAVEPVPQTYEHLLENLRLNELEDKVMAHPMGLGERGGRLRFSDNKGAMNQVLTDDETRTASVEVSVLSLDALLAGKVPTLLKLDVEGYEFPVLSGAKQALASIQLKAIIMELNGTGKKYGHADEEIHQLLLSYRFRPFKYDPLGRKLDPIKSFNRSKFNTLYIRSEASAFAEARVQNARKFRVNGREF